MQKIFLFFVLLFSIGCVPNKSEKKPSKNDEVLIYSKHVRDSFMVFTDLPDDYDPNIKYPVVYMLDGNYYFKVMKEALELYTYIDIPPVILVCIGYTDENMIDEKRDRDNTYPVAIPDYEMKKSGGADLFLQFFSDELQPYIDKKYSTDTNQRIIAGHSLSGYFVLHAFRRTAERQHTGFTRFLAASPSLNYNDGYMLKELKTLQNKSQDSLMTYVSYGMLEDVENEGDTIEMKTGTILSSLAPSFERLKVQRVAYTTDTFSGLGHMYTPMPSFLKGIRWMLTKK